MTSKKQERHNALRKKLVDIAERQITFGGINSVKARALATEADCALGAIYTVFDDLNHIILEVNGRTFRQLGESVEKKMQAHPDDTPTEKLITIAEAYLDFALNQTNRWRSLFDIPFSPDLDVPQWYWEEMDKLFKHINGPVRECYPRMSETDQGFMTRALFSSVHGIVSLGIENRVSPVPRADLSRMIKLILQKSTETQ